MYKYLELRPEKKVAPKKEAGIEDINTGLDDDEEKSEVDEELEKFAD